MAKIEVKVPDIGDFKDVPIIEILVKPGDAVKAEQPLLTLESDKATMDVPSPAAGVVGEIVAKVGDKVVDGRAAADARDGGRRRRAGAARLPTSARAGAGARRRRGRAALAARRSAPRRGPALADFSGVFAGPAVRRLARELGVDLTTHQGHRRKGPHHASTT